MIRDIKKFPQGLYDLLVIGGGINGAAIAHLAALNGLKVALIEKGDFAGGTSSKSTKLVHGGIRYLEHFDFGLVKEALKERFIQLHAAPHLVKSLPFIIPVYRGDKRPLWMMKFGVWLYDFFSGPYSIGRHRSLTHQDIVNLEPKLKSEDLLGGALYYDAQMDDARLCLENVLMAERYGAHAANYVEAVELLKENGKVIGVKARDLITKEVFKIRAMKTIATTGPWTNEFLKLDNRTAKKKIRTTKGVHIVYKGKLTQKAVLITSKHDDRVFFVIPWMGNSLIGTTDTNYIQSPDDVQTSQKDIDYLLKETKRVFPAAHIDEKNIITTFAGLRPLVRRGGSPSAVTRQHTIDETYSGLVVVIGGKYTTYRKVAEDTLKKITKKQLKNTEKHFTVYGSGKIKEDPKDIAKKYHVSDETVEYLMGFYGARYMDIVDLIKENNALKEPLCSCSKAIKAQVVYSIETEMALKEDDVIARRLSLEYLPCPTHQCRKTIQKIIKEYF